MESFNPKRLKMSEEGNCSTTTEETVFEPFTSDFAKIVKMKCFVDKTPLLRAIFYKAGGSGIVITAPRRFGKSTNMDMVNKFVEIQVDANGAVIQKDQSSNYNIFKNNNLLIYQDEKFFKQHFATYPVLRVDFKCISGKTFDTILQGFRILLRETFGQYKYLLQSDNLDSNRKSRFRRYYEEKSCLELTISLIKVGLCFLSECLFKHFNNKQVFVLIDDYDTPINNAMFTKDIDVNEVNELLSQIFSNTLKENPYVKRALLTGSSYFATVALYGANNILKYMFLDKHPFVPYYGLTEKEVADLLTKFQIDDKTKEEVREHYNGYVSLGGTKLFSIWSVLNFLKKKEIKNYWEQSGSVINLKEALKLPSVRYHIEKICRKESVVMKMMEQAEIYKIVNLRNVCLQEADEETNEFQRPDLYLSFIFQQGYLTYDLSYKNVGNPHLCAVKAPNTEIINEFQNKLREFYFPSVNSCLDKCKAIFDKISVGSDDELFREFVTEFNTLISTSKSKYFEDDESHFHSLMFNILCKTKFSLGTEFLFYKAKVDLILYAGNLGIIIEVEYKKTSEDALKQIITKYLNVFNDEIRFENVTDKIYIGINVSENHKVEVGVLVNSAKLDEAKIFS